MTQIIDTDPIMAILGRTGGTYDPVLRCRRRLARGQLRVFKEEQLVLAESDRDGLGNLKVFQNGREAGNNMSRRT